MKSLWRKQKHKQILELNLALSSLNLPIYFWKKKQKIRQSKYTNKTSLPWMICEPKPSNIKEDMKWKYLWGKNHLNFEKNEKDWLLMWKQTEIKEPFNSNDVFKRKEWVYCFIEF